MVWQAPQGERARTPWLSSCDSSVRLPRARLPQLRHCWTAHRGIRSPGLSLMAGLANFTLLGESLGCGVPRPKAPTDGSCPLAVPPLGVAEGLTEARKQSLMASMIPFETLACRRCSAPPNSRRLDHDYL